MLAVHRQQQPSPPLPRCQRELPRHDEALLVRKRQGDPALERPQRRVEAGKPHDRVEHEVGLRPLEQRGQIAADLHVLDAVLRHKRAQVLGARRDRAELELGMGGDDLECLAPDRTGGAEERDPFHRDDVGRGRLSKAEGSWMHIASTRQV